LGLNILGLLWTEVSFPTPISQACQRCSRQTECTHIQVVFGAYEEWYFLLLHLGQRISSYGGTIASERFDVVTGTKFTGRFCNDVAVVIVS
jgi:hypothetical protein